jgi:hypothetical protein
VLLLKTKNHCHSDLKPGNVTLLPVPTGAAENCYTAKVIDFGALSKNELAVRACTAEYYYSPLRTYDSTSGRIVFKSMEERYKTEFYSVLRTM